MCYQKLLLNNVIALYVSRPKADMLPFDDEIDTNSSHILNRSEYDKDDDESSDNGDLKPENPEFYQAKKRK